MTMHGGSAVELTSLNSTKGDQCRAKSSVIQNASFYRFSGMSFFQSLRILVNVTPFAPVVTTFVLVAIVGNTVDSFHRFKDSSTNQHQSDYNQNSVFSLWETTQHAQNHRPPTIAFGGNSMLYYNDCPRLVEILLKRNANDFNNLHHLQDSCLQGGANLSTLWKYGNGMQTKFGSNNNTTTDNKCDIGAPTIESLLQNSPPFSYAETCWDYIVLQDNTPDPTQDASRQISIQALQEHYIPAISRSQISSQTSSRCVTTVILLQPFPFKTPRLRQHAFRGSYNDFSNALDEGYDAYARVVREAGLNCRIVPMARAVQLLHDNYVEFWDEHMYNWDDVHPSPHATWLQACLIVATSTYRAPPMWVDSDIGKNSTAEATIAAAWQQRARYWQNNNHGKYSPLPLPTAKEAEMLRQLSCKLVVDMVVVDSSLGFDDKNFSVLSSAVTTAKDSSNEINFENACDVLMTMNT